jgi:predicted DNA-binding transcriptional regulator AlpA
MLLSYTDLREKKGIRYTKMHLRRLADAGKFPRPTKLNDAPNSPNTWDEGEVDDHIAKRLAARAAERNSAPEAP